MEGWYEKVGSKPQTNLLASSHRYWLKNLEMSQHVTVVDKWYTPTTRENGRMTPEVTVIFIRTYVHEQKMLFSHIVYKVKIGWHNYKCKVGSWNIEGTLRNEGILGWNVFFWCWFFVLSLCWLSLIFPTSSFKCISHIHITSNITSDIECSACLE